MEILTVELNLVAVVISIVLAFVVGALWYTQVLFGTLWQKLVGLSDAEVAKDMASSMGIGVVTIAIMVVGFGLIRGWLELPMAVVLQNDSAIVISIAIALALWVFTIFPSIWMNNNYQRKAIMLTLIDSGYQLVVLVVAAIVFAVLA